MEAIGKLMAVEPVMVPKKSGFGKEPDYWETAKKNILNRPRLLDDLLGYDKDNINPNIILSIGKIINHNDFKPDTIKISSVAAFGLSMWSELFANTIR